MVKRTDEMIKAWWDALSDKERAEMAQAEYYLKMSYYLTEKFGLTSKRADEIIKEFQRKDEAYTLLQDRLNLLSEEVFVLRMALKEEKPEALIAVDDYLKMVRQSQPNPRETNKGVAGD